MQITKREFLKKLGLGGAAVATGAAFGDEYVPITGRLPEGSCGDPENDVESLHDLHGCNWPKL